MANKSTDFALMAFSVQVYKVLLNAYPIRFQQEYGADMVQAFQDCCLRALRQGGINGMVRLWWVTLLDLIQSVISEHTQKEVQMKKEMNPEDIRMAGAALIWGAVAFIVGTLSMMGGPKFYGISVILVVFLSMPLLVLGLLGVRNRYCEKVGAFGKNILLVGATLGPLLSLIGLLGIVNASLWILLVMGPAVLFTCLVLFGLVALYKKPLPQWNAMPILAGAWYPITMLIIRFARLGDLERGSAIYNALFIIMSILYIIQGIALAALGYILKSDAPKETAAPAQ
jgi:hypothetical protein